MKQLSATCGLLSKVAAAADSRKFPGIEYSFILKCPNKDRLEREQFN